MKLNEPTILADSAACHFSARRYEGSRLGDRIQFTAPANELKIPNRELGVIRNIDEAGRLSLEMDSGRSLQIDPNKYPPLDYGYAMTSHSSQGQTANRVLIHAYIELAAKGLLNNRMAYVYVSRGALQLFTNDCEKLPTTLTMFQSRSRKCFRATPNRRLRYSWKSPAGNRSTVQVLESVFRTPACPG